MRFAPAAQQQPDGKIVQYLEIENTSMEASRGAEDSDDSLGDPAQQVGASVSAQPSQESQLTSDISPINAAAIGLLSSHPQGTGIHNNSSAATSASHARLAELSGQRMSLEHMAPLAGTPDLNEVNLRVQAVLRQEEERLKALRLLLQQQLERSSAASSSTPAARSEDNQSPVAAASAATNIAASSTSATPKDDPLSRSNSKGDVAASGGDGTNADGERPAGLDADPAGDDNDSEDNLDDEEYFKNFDTEDSHILNNETFPSRLYRMLYEAQKEGRQDIVSFSSNGKIVCIHKPRRFVAVSHFLSFLVQGAPFTQCYL